MMKKKVTVFTQPGLTALPHGTAYLSERGIEFEDRDVSTDPRQLKTWCTSTRATRRQPWLWDDEVMIGFDPERLDQLLAC